MPHARKPRLCLYGYSTSGQCAKAQAWLEEKEVDYDLVYLDQLDEEAQAQTISELEQRAEPLSFPLVVFDGTVVMGYCPQDYEVCLEVEA